MLHPYYNTIQAVSHNVCPLLVCCNIRLSRQIPLTDHAQEIDICKRKSSRANIPLLNDILNRGTLVLLLLERHCL